jgi:hypothetical protein
LAINQCISWQVINNKSPGKNLILNKYIPSFPDSTRDLSLITGLGTIKCWYFEKERKYVCR